MTGRPAPPAPELGVDALFEVGRQVEPPSGFTEQARIREDSVYDEAERDFRSWWAKQAENLLDWVEPWHTVLDDTDAPFYRWFVGGKLNACYNCVDRHVAAGRGERVAFHWRGEKETREVTYADLHRDTQRLANVLKARGIGKGDVVAIHLPLVPEAAVAMLACARIGAPHNVVFAGFSAHALREQLVFSEARALITADGVWRDGGAFPLKARINEHVADLDGLGTVVVLRHTGSPAEMCQGRDIWWDEALAAAPPDCPCEPLDAEHPLFTLYTSGSTAKPKVVVHSTGGYLTGVGWTTQNVFDLRPDRDVFWCTADVGWVTGHSYVIYGPLLSGATSVMFEGSPDHPHRGVWWETIEKYRVTILYTAPTSINAFLRWGEEHPGRHDLSSLRLLGSVGEPLTPKAWGWYHQVIGGSRCPIVDTWWQTETGCIMITTLPGVMASKPGAAGRPLPGIHVDVVDEEGDPVRGEYGYLVVKRPWPAMLRNLHKQGDRYRQTYFGRFEEQTYLGRFEERTYYVGDSALVDEDGYFWIGGRVDDVINVGGRRFAASQVESAIASHPGVAECAAIGQRHETTGYAICAFIVLRQSLGGGPELERQIGDRVAERLGENARPARIVWTASLPKTRSGKIMRRLLRDIAEGRDLGDVSALRDPDVIDELEQAFSEQPA